MNIVNKIKDIHTKNKVIFQNFSYLTAMQFFLMLVPLFTYPYLIRVLGKELYGYVITAQIVASYFSIVVDFGFKSVSARYVSIYRNDKSALSELMSNIMFVRGILWAVSFIAFLIIIYMVESYREHFLLFLFSFGITFNELLFPQFFFQGIEKMKVITIINILIRSIFLVFIFVFIKSQTDYVYVPLFLSIGYFLGGIISLFVIYRSYDLSIVKPKRSQIKLYSKDAVPIFYTDIVCTIKDKLSYLIVGNYVSMADVPIYDLGAKFVTLLAKPMGILSTVLFPRIAQNKNIPLFKKGLFISFTVTVLLVLVTNLVLPYLVAFFIDENIDLLPIRLFLLAPILTSVGTFIASNLIIAFGYSKYILYSIIVTTIGYCVGLGVFFSLNYMTVLSMVIVALFGYFTELVYRIYIARKIIKNEEKV